MLTSPPLILDTDVISCFGWVRRMDILESLYSGKMQVPVEVIAELGNRKTPHLKQALDNSINNFHIQPVYLDLLGPEMLEFARLLKVGSIGTGEAAVMAYVRYHSGTVSSNNMRDVLNYCIQYNLALIGTSAIIYDAIVKGVLTLPDANNIWSYMLKKGRKIYFQTATDVYNYYSTGIGASRGIQKY